MNDELIRDLLHEVADDVEPGDRLDAIRAATAPARRTHRGWWVGGGAGLVAASVVTALALTTGGAPQTDGPGPADVPSAPPSSPTTAPAAPTAVPTDPGPGSGVVAVYFVGDTTRGPRLFREFQPRADRGDAAAEALVAAVEGRALDADYRSAWPLGASVRSVERTASGIVVDLRDVPDERPDGVSAQDAGLAVEQVVRTAQAAYGLGKLPVRLVLEGAESGRILGVATAEALTGAPDADVLAPVSLSEPSEGQVVRAGRLIVTDGRAISTDGRITLRVQRWQGTAVALGPVTFTLSPVDGPFEAFGGDLGSDDLQPGDYDVIATVQNADGTVDSDTRRITVVD